MDIDFSDIELDTEDIANLEQSSKDAEDLDKYISKETKQLLADMKYKYYNGSIDDLYNPAYHGTEQHKKDCDEIQRQLEADNEYMRGLPDDFWDDPEGDDD